MSKNFGLELSANYASSNTHARQFDDLTGALNRDRDTETSVFSADAKLDGALWKTGAGPVQFAVGAQYRKEEFDRGNRIGSSFTFQNDRNLLAGFLELRVPLIGPNETVLSGNRLELVLADRYEHYSDFGSTNNPRIGAIFRPFSGLRFRGTYGTSFKAPLLDNMNGQPTDVVAAGLVDPSTACSCGITDTLIVIGGNPNLAPEDAKTWTVGVDLEPQRLQGVRVGVTYYNIRYEDRIVAPSQTVFFFDALTREAILGAKIVQRNPTSAQIDQLMADPAFVDFRPFTGSSGAGFGAIADFRLQNLSEVDTSGVDLSISYSTSSALGQLDVGVDGTYILEFDNQFAPTAPITEILNTPYSPIDLRLRGRGVLQHGDLKFALFLNYTDSYTDNRVFIAGTPTPVKSWTTVDTTIGYEFSSDRGLLSDLSATLGVINLTDEDPPFLQNRFSPVNYDGANANALGRFVSLQLLKQW